MIAGINFDLIDKYAIYTEDEGLVGIREDATKEAKEEYEKLKEIMRINTERFGHF